MKRSTLDMTTGAPLPLLVRFALPLMLGSFFQQMYSFADTAIVGRCISVDALSNPIAWAFAMVYCLIAVWFLLKRKELEFKK